MGRETLYVKPTIPGKSLSEQELEAIKPFVLPEPKKDEKYFSYVTGIKYNSPFNYQHFDKVDFAKQVIKHPDASLVANDGKHYPVRFMTKLLTESQAEAIKERAKKRRKKISGRPNLEYDARTPGSKEFLDPLDVCVWDYLILVKTDNYNPSKEEEDFIKKAEEEANKEQDEIQKTSKDIYDAQRKTSKKGK